MSKPWISRSTKCNTMNHLNDIEDFEAGFNNSSQLFIQYKQPPMYVSMCRQIFRDQLITASLIIRHIQIMIFLARVFQRRNMNTHYLDDEM